MNKRSLTILLGALAVLVLAVIWQSRTGPTGTIAPGELLLPGLRAELNDVTEVRVTGSGNRAIATLSLEDGAWTVAESGDYPADVGRLRKNLLALSDARILESKTANPDFYERLGVGDVESEGSRGVQFDVTGSSGTLYSAIVGDTGVSGGDNAYVRRTGEAQSWLVSADFDPGTDTVDWLDADIVDLPASDIASVRITHPDGEALVIEKADADDFNFNVLDVPEGRELSYSTVANSIGGALAALRFENVYSADEGVLGDQKPISVQFKTRSGLVATVSVYESDDGRRMTFDFAQTEIESTTDDTETAEDTDGTVEALTADDLNDRVRGWVYELPTYKSDQLVKRMGDLLKSEEEEDPAA